MTGCSVRDVEEPETLLSEPSDGVVKTISKLNGDIIVIGYQPDGSNSGT
jgi:hypothetical protein